MSATSTTHSANRPPLFVENPQGGVLINGAPKPPVIFNAAAKSPEFADRLRAHYRETRRMAVDIPCTIELVLDDGTIYNAGDGIVRNISPSGALITHMLFPHFGFPAAPFKLHMVLNGDPYSGIGIEATPVRIVTKGGFGLGVKFDEIFVAV